MAINLENMSTIGHQIENRQRGRTACELRAECLKLSGRSDVFTARSINYHQDGIVLVSRKAVKPGTLLVVRVLNFPSAQVLAGNAGLRSTGLAEVRWVEEFMDTDGLAYAMSLRYLYAD